MKIIWFTNTPSNASLDFGHNLYGGGWISSLETLIVESNKYELGICFFYKGENYKKVKKNNVVYYGIPLKTGSVFERVISRHWAKLDDEDSNYFDAVLDDFKPDLIHVFGTESGYGKILMNKSEKVLFHLQGLVKPYAGVYFPSRFNSFNILINSKLSSILRGLTPLHDFRIFKKSASREQDIIKYWKYFSGRTDWDRYYIKLLNPDAQYFHCDELLRKEFYENIWIPPSKVKGSEEIIIGSTISPNLYKGLDLVYKVMNLINSNTIRWKIFGINEKDILNNTVKGILRLKKKPENIKFYGQISSTELIKELKTCHFFVHPSYIDNSPNSVCEAMILGMPVLSSSVGGIRSLIIDKETGFLFNPYDIYDLAGLLVHLIKNYEITKHIGLNARKVALKRHSYDRILSELSKIYDIIYNKK